MTKAQLYYPDSTKRLFTSAHSFYVEQMRVRIFSQFADLEGEAEKKAEEVYRDLGHRYPGGDWSEAAEIAHEAGSDHYISLTEMRDQVLMGGLAGMFHQWDKTIREYLVRELNHDFDNEKIEKLVWNGTFEDVLNIFSQFGWDVQALPFYPKLDALQLIVNVYKHGNGRSLTKLRNDYSQYLRDPTGDWNLGSFTLQPDHTWLTIEQDQFIELSNAVLDFWTAMPERLYLELAS